MTLSITQPLHCVGKILGTKRLSEPDKGTQNRRKPGAMTLVFLFVLCVQLGISSGKIQSRKWRVQVGAGP